MTQEDFKRTRNFLAKYVKLLVKTESLKQGYAIDSEFYGIGEYTSYIEEGLQRLTLEDVNRAARQHIDLNRFCLVAVGPEMESLATQLNANAQAPIEYEIEQPEEVLLTDRMAAAYPLRILSLKTISFEDAFGR